MSKQPTKPVTNAVTEEEINQDEMIVFFEKALKKLDPKTQSETIEQIEYTIAQLKSGS